MPRAGLCHDFLCVLLHSDASMHCFYLGGIGIDLAYLFPFWTFYSEYPCLYRVVY